MKQRTYEIHPDVRHFRLVFETPGRIDDGGSAEKRSQLTKNLTGLEYFVGLGAADERPVDIVVEGMGRERKPPSDADPEQILSRGRFLTSVPTP